MFTWIYWKQVLERALKTGGQAILLGFTGDAFNVLTMDWTLVGGAFLTGCFFSLLTSLVSTGIGPDKDNPSVVLATDPRPVEFR